MGSSAGARLLASPAGLSRSEKYLRRSTSKPRGFEHFLQVAGAEIEQVARHVDAIPARPSRRNCHEAALGTWTTRRPSGASSCARGFEVRARVVRCSSTWNMVMRRRLPARNGSVLQRGADGGNLLAPPGDGGGFARIIQAQHAKSALAHHAEKQAAAAAHIEQRTARAANAASACATKRTWSRRTRRR